MIDVGEPGRMTNQGGISTDRRKRTGADRTDRTARPIAQSPGTKITQPATDLALHIQPAWPADRPSRVPRCHAARAFASGSERAIREKIDQLFPTGRYSSKIFDDDVQVGRRNGPSVQVCVDYPPAYVDSDMVAEIVRGF